MSVLTLKPGYTVRVMKNGGSIPHGTLCTVIKPVIAQGGIFTWVQYGDHQAPFAPDDIELVDPDPRLFDAAPAMLEALQLVQSSLSTYRATGAFTPGQPSSWLMSMVSSAIALATNPNQETQS